MTERAREILGKHLDMCDKRRELKKKRFEPEGSEKYKVVNNSIKRCMKKAKENWIGEQCNEIEENLRKNNSKKAYELVKPAIFGLKSLRKSFYTKSLHISKKTTSAIFSNLSTAPDTAPRQLLRVVNDLLTAMDEDKI